MLFSLEKYLQILFRKRDDELQFCGHAISNDRRCTAQSRHCILNVDILNFTNQSLIERKQEK